MTMQHSSLEHGPPLNHNLKSMAILLFSEKNSTRIVPNVFSDPNRDSLEGGGGGGVKIDPL